MKKSKRRRVASSHHGWISHDLLKDENTALNANTIVADKLNRITFSIDDKAQFNVKDFVFKGGNVSTNKYYGQNVWLQEGARLTLA